MNNLPQEQANIKSFIDQKIKDLQDFLKDLENRENSSSGKKSLLRAQIVCYEELLSEIDALPTANVEDIILTLESQGYTITPPATPTGRMKVLPLEEMWRG